MDSVDDLYNAIVQRMKDHNGGSLFTVAISGIDASGKGYITKLLQKKLECRGCRVANINIDPWQHPIPIRLQRENAAENVYKNIFRWNDFFNQLIFPIQKNKGIVLETAGIHTHADEYYSLQYDYEYLDVLLVEGIFLFKREYLSYYHFKIWINCSFEEGLRRAIHRNAERLKTDRLIEDYNTFYYPAQRLHLERDNPVEAADIIFDNETMK